MKLCECGCGGYVKERKYRNVRFIKNHHKPWLGKKNLLMVGNKYRQGLSPWNKGREVPEEQKERQRQKMLGRKIWNGNRGEMEWTTGENNKLWKGDKVGYVALHTWLVRNYGKACKCEFCHTLEAKRYEWANKSGEYKRDIGDWMQLCTKCHRSYDINNIWGKAVEKYPERKRNANL